MTIEEKAKRYGETLERASNIRKDAVEMENTITTKTCEVIFPELKESEDGKIRKALIRFHKSTIDVDGIKGEDILAWLEKQGTPSKLSEEEQNRFAKGVLTSCAMSFINYLDAHKHEGKMCVSNGECEDIENAFQNAMWDRLHRYYCKYIEKQGEQNLIMAKSPQLGEQKPFDYEDANIQQKDFAPKFAMEAAKEEKADNANKVELKDYSSIDPHFGKPADKFKPKFKLGDWITDGCLHCKIIQVLDECYIVDSKFGKTSIFFKREYNYHLWSIQDARDGDILAGSKDEVILMFRGIGNTEWNDVIDYHCYYDCYRKEFIVQEKLGFWGNVDDTELKPATKEQRDLLFQKMREAGYEWDAEKKELKKISQRMISAEAKEAMYGKPTAWSEEDEQITLSIEQVMNCASLLNIVPEKTDKIRTWLKSLKQRIGG